MTMYELNEDLERQIVEAAIRDEVSSLKARMSNAGRDFAAAELARRARALPSTWLFAAAIAIFLRFSLYCLSPCVMRSLPVSSSSKSSQVLSAW